MKFSEADSSGGLLIKGYEAGRIRVGDTDYPASLIVTPQQVIAPWAPQSISKLSEEDFQLLLDLNPEVIVLGTGANHCFPEPAIYAGLMGRGVGLEIMDTGAACRTYNILMAESRRVVAALIKI